MTKKQTGTSMVQWDEELARDAEIAAKQEQKPQGNFLSTKGGQLSFQGNPIAGNVLNVIVVHHVYENVFYAGDYDADNPQSPACYAFAEKEVDLCPSSEDCEDVQHEQCEGCPQNEWGSAERGRGKACKNTRRLAVIPADAIDSPEAIADAQVAILGLPVTSVKGWSTYVQQLAVMKRPPYSVVTQVSVTPDNKNQYMVGFKFVEKIDAEYLGAIKTKREEVATILTAPYPKNSERTVAAPKAKKKSLSAKRAKF